MFSQQMKPVKVSDHLIDEIRKDVWQPFMESYRDLDSEKFKSIHNSNILRITIDANKIENGSPYLNNLGNFLQQVKKMNRQVAIRFSIISTAIGADKAYQTEYYCFLSRGSDKESFAPRGYGFFNVVLGKENGKWKIEMDADKSIQIKEEKFRESGVIYELN